MGKKKEVFDIGVIKHLTTIAKEKGEGVYEEETTIGPVSINVSEKGRKTFYHDKKCVAMKALKTMFSNLPEDKENSEDQEDPKHPNLELSKKLAKKAFKVKKAIPIFVDSGLAKKKKQKKLFKLWEAKGKKITGSEIMDTIEEAGIEGLDSDVISFIESL